MVDKMADLILQVTEQNGDLFVDSRLIALRLDIQHETFMRTIKKYESKIEKRFGCIRFDFGVPESATGNPPKFAWLTEDQATTLMTFSKNTEIVIDCKLDLVAAFSEAKRIIKTIIPAQNDRLRELELINENMRLEIQRMDRMSSMTALHGVPTTLCLMGRDNAIVEVEKSTIEVIDDRHNQQTKYSGQTCTQLKDYMKKRFGITFRSGADVQRVLEEIETKFGVSLLAELPRTVTTTYIPDEHTSKAIEYLRDVKNWQMLIGQ
jgi:phage regulator Rha-like protein